jgi:hypothetical protein
MATAARRGPPGSIGSRARGPPTAHRKWRAARDPPRSSPVLTSHRCYFTRVKRLSRARTDPLFLRHWPCRSPASASRCARRVPGRHRRRLSPAAPSQRAPSRRRPAPVFSRNPSLRTSGPRSSPTNAAGMDGQSSPRPPPPSRSSRYFRPPLYPLLALAANGARLI